VYGSMHQLVRVLFRFNNTWSNVDINALPDRSLQNYMNATMEPDGRLHVVGNQIRVPSEPYEMPDPLPEFSITFRGVIVPFNVVSKCLHAFGIIPSTTTEEYFEDD
jgi:hypothetical protein